MKIPWLFGQSEHSATVEGVRRLWQIIEFDDDIALPWFKAFSLYATQARVACFSPDREWLIVKYKIILHVMVKLCPWKILKWSDQVLVDGNTLLQIMHRNYSCLVVLKKVWVKRTSAQPKLSLPWVRMERKSFRSRLWPSSWLEFWGSCQEQHKVCFHLILSSEVLAALGALVVV